MNASSTGPVRPGRLRRPVAAPGFHALPSRWNCSSALAARSSARRARRWSRCCGGNEIASTFLVRAVEQQVVVLGRADLGSFNAG